jgi:Ca2+/H+ antiporter
MVAEIFSFVSLFGIAAVFLGYQRFGASIVLFALACMALAVTFLFLSFSFTSYLKSLLTISTCVGTILLMFYLMGLVAQAETDCYAGKISNDIAASKRAGTNGVKRVHRCC